MGPTVQKRVKMDLKIRDSMEQKSFKFPGWYKVEISAPSSGSETFSGVTTFETHSGNFEVLCHLRGCGV